MTAMLGMYDMPTLQPVNDRFWSLIRGHLGFGPENLTRDRDYWEIWQDPDLVFAQTCGMPYRTRLHGSVQLVGTPDYDLPGCPPGHYCSVFVARADDARDLDDLVEGRFAYNEALSQSGWAAPVTHLLQQALKPHTLLETGGHALSAQAVADRRADYASLDALTWVLLQEVSGVGKSLREVARTAPTPTLPFITSIHQDPDQVATAVVSAISDLPAADQKALHLRGMINIPASQYLSVPNPPKPEAIQQAN